MSSMVVVTSSTGCAGNNAVGKGAGIRFNSLEHEALVKAVSLLNLVSLLCLSRMETQLHLLFSCWTKTMNVEYLFPCSLEAQKVVVSVADPQARDS